MGDPGSKTVSIADSVQTISLGTALEKTRAIYDAAHRRRMSRAEIARYLGYGGLNGAAVAVIANLTRYGLLVGRGEAITVSEDAVTALVEPRDSAERRAAIRRLAGTPSVFADLMRQLEGGPVSETAVRIRLERLGLKAKSAEIMARAFFETMALVGADGEAHTAPDDSAHLSVREEYTNAPLTTADPAVATSAASIPAPISGTKQDVFTLTEGDVVLRWPANLSRDSYADLKDWLEVMVRKIGRVVTKDPDGSHD
jgi:hypothetical protein